MYSYRDNKIASLLLLNNVLVRRPHNKSFRGHHHSQQQQQQRVVHVRSIATTSITTTNTEYKNFSHKLLTVEQVVQNPSSNSTTLQQQDQLVFGKQFTPHMLQIQYIHQQWTEPKIVPYQNLSLSPAASSLHYGTFGTVPMTFCDSNCH